MMVLVNFFEGKMSLVLVFVDEVSFFFGQSDDMLKEVICNILGVLDMIYKVVLGQGVFVFDKFLVLVKVKLKLDLKVEMVEVVLLLVLVVIVILDEVVCEWDIVL